MTVFGKLSSHCDRAGSGFGTTFLPQQKCLLAFAQTSLQNRGVACALDYTYQCERAEATFTLMGHDGQPVAGVKCVERWQKFGDEKKPSLHTVYDYDVFTGTPSRGWLRVAFVQVQENRDVPPLINTAIRDSLHDLARGHALFPTVRALRFGVQS